MIRAVGRWLGRLLLGLGVLAGAVWAFGPREPVEVAARFDAGRLGAGVGAYLAEREAGFDDITPGVEKRVIWAGAPEVKTPVSVLYVHGFSATSEELRPVPDRVAGALGANLVFTRLRGHGRSGAALGEVSVADWMADMAEALAVARAVGEEVLVIATSTGGTLMAEAALQAGMADAVKGIVFVSPNFGINDPAAALLTWPGARHVLPHVVGRERSWTPSNDRHGTFWTTRYPFVAVFPMAALVQHAWTRDYRGVDIPALFYFAPDDRVVRGERTEAFAARWGGPVSMVRLPAGADVSPGRHVIAGDIVSPGNTRATVALVLDWLGGV